MEQCIFSVSVLGVGRNLPFVPQDILRSDLSKVRLVLGRRANVQGLQAGR